MTNHWIDLKNSDCILIMGANPAENHPVAMRWALQAREDNGATLISVDPRYTRTSAVADVVTRLRSGSDIAFLGGMINYITSNDLIQRDYVLHYTNAAMLIDERFEFDEAEGVFSGYDEEARKYDKTSWKYQFAAVQEQDRTSRGKTLTPYPSPASGRGELFLDSRLESAAGATGEPKKDPTLQHPRCVYQLLKKHFQRYDLDTVSGITGTPQEDLERVYRTFAATSAADKAGTIMYAMGWTQHTVGTQNVRTMAIIQLLLGNVGLAGGGINALRGESNVQGSTDHGLLFHVWPGYLKTPKASQTTLDDYHREHTPGQVGRRSANWWSNYAKYSVSFLKSMFGNSATEDNDFGYAWLPKLDEGVDYSWLTIFEEMLQGDIKGFFAWGQNPACSGANANKNRLALSKLDWLVNVNIFPSETGWFWDDADLADEQGRPIKPEDIKTEVFVLPAAVSFEKEGSVTNSARWCQWRYKAADPPGDAKPDAEIMDLIFRELRKLYQADANAVFPEPILNVAWDKYFDAGKLNAHVVAREINGEFIEGPKKGQQVPSFNELADDGSTSSGNWLYCGSYTEEGNMAQRRRREPDGGLGLNSNWAWCWPLNRRIIYNRASVDPRGVPWNGQRPVIAFTGEVENGKYVTNRWQGDVPDGGWYPLQDPDGTQRRDAKRPFIMLPDGHAQLFAPGLADGPFPEHYEPLETPLAKNPLNAKMLNPAARQWTGLADRFAENASGEFPYVCSTYRVTEHWQTGVMTRHCPWLLELQPQLFVELSLQLAAEKGIKAGDWVDVSSKRGMVTAVAMPTPRLKPFTVAGKTIHQVGLPWCFGWKMPGDGSDTGSGGGDSANLLTPNVGDANTMIPETKAFLVNVQKSTRKDVTRPRAPTV